MFEVRPEKTKFKESFIIVSGIVGSYLFKAGRIHQRSGTPKRKIWGNSLCIQQVYLFIIFVK